MIESGLVVPILQTKPKLPGVPLLRDLLPASDGPLLTLVLALEDFGLPLVGPPGMAEERVALLRHAFLQMGRDPDYQAEAARMTMPVGAPIGGDRLAAMVGELAATTSPDVIAAYRRLTEGN
jgi:hypothetical protein